MWGGCCLRGRVSQSPHAPYIHPAHLLEEIPTRGGGCQELASPRTRLQADLSGGSPVVPEPVDALCEVAQVCRHWYVVHPRPKRLAEHARLVPRHSLALDVEERPAAVQQVGNSCAEPGALDVEQAGPPGHLLLESEVL
eukprot:150828-Prymnesium_polylepis.1